MSLFLGHRRRAHDIYYRIQFGHFGLVDAFVELEKSQTDPFMDKLVQIYAVTDPTVSSLTTSVDFSDISNCSTLVHQKDLLSDPLCTSISKFVINSSTLSSLINSISDKYIVSRLNTNSSNLSPPNNSVLDNHCRSIVSVRDCFGGRRMSLKEFSIRIPRLDVRNLYNAVSAKNISSNLNNIKAMKNNKKYLFSLKSDETIFLNIFQKFISRVENHLPVSKAEIIHKANNNSEFAPVLLLLKSGHSGDVYQKVYAKIRTIGYGLRDSNGKNSLKLTPSTKSQLDLTFQTGNHKSIFLYRKMRIYFFCILKYDHKY